MEITDVFVLPPDAELVQVGSLPDAEKAKLSARDDDVAITRLRSRHQSKIIDGQMAALISAFETGNTLVDAVMAFSDENGHAPQTVLEAAYPVFEKLIKSKLLVPEGSPDLDPVEASLAEGDRWAGMTVIKLVQVLADTELYKAETDTGQMVALKIARQPENKSMIAAVAREAAILEHLAGDLSPILAATGHHDGKAYLACQWLDGVSGARAAAGLRSIHSRDGRRRLLDLCCRILDAYALLHRQQVIHGDVHPGNFIVGDDGSLKIIDFGLSRMPFSADGKLSRAARAGFGYFFEPEYAQRYVAKAKPPQCSFLGEQHILAHLLFRLITGHNIADFSAEREESMAQLAQSRPEPFVHWGVAPWPDVEEVLGRALSLDPNARFGSVEDLAKALRHAAIPEPIIRKAKSTVPLTTALSNGLLKDYLRQLDPADRLFETGLPEPPYSSLTYGSAGVAYCLYRLAQMREDSNLLSWAKLWSERSIAEITTKKEEAFTTPDGDVTAEAIGPISLYHTASGLYFTQALVAQAMGDRQSEMDAVRAFCASAAPSCESIDLTLGRAGVLLGCALMKEAMPMHENLGEQGERLFEDIAQEVRAMAPIAEERTLTTLGIAHGWAGVLYALLMWCRMAGKTPPGHLADRLDQLAELAEPAKAGVSWRIRVDAGTSGQSARTFPSWCNGTAGMIHLWTLAHAMLDDERYLSMAEGAAWNIIAARSSVDQLCCGRPGHSYGVLNLYKHTGEKHWLDHAMQMADQSLQLARIARQDAAPPFYYGLYKGPIGAALLAADLEKPMEAAMPAFEAAGWRG